MFEFLIIVIVAYGLWKLLSDNGILIKLANNKKEKIIVL